MPRPLICALAALVFCLGASRPAAATAKADVSYTRQQVYSGALRYLRIELGCDITEKDDQAAYLLFKYQPQGQREASFGALEIIERAGAVAVLVKLPRLPSYYETLLRDGLVRKLQEDYGINKPRRPAAPAPEKPLEPPPEAQPPAESSDLE